MPQLHPNIIAHLGDREQRTNFIVELLTPTPRRWTNYRGRASNGQRGLVIGAVYYRAYDVTIPAIDESEGVGPIFVDLVIANANNLSTALVSDSANLGKRITITKLHFHDATWDEATQPTSIEQQPWFEGFTGSPAFQGENVIIKCRADMGRRGASPKTESRTLMHSHTPPPQGHRLNYNVYVKN